MSNPSSGSGKPYSIPDVGGIDLNKIYGRGAAGKGVKEPDYIPYNKKGRDIWSRVPQVTGIFWLGGFAGGSLYGCKEGWDGAANTSSKVRFNSVLNGMSRRGAKVANALGFIGACRTLQQ